MLGTNPNELYQELYFWPPSEAITYALENIPESSSESEGSSEGSNERNREGNSEIESKSERESDYDSVDEIYARENSSDSDEE